MLNDKDRELISIGASLAAGCQPCARFHLRAAQIAGASDAEINQAANDALSVSRHATEQMAELARQYLGAANPDATVQANPLLRELVAISAACAINSSPELETHLAAARTLGATKAQILSAIKIASAVKDTAERKVEEATARALEGKPTEAESCCQPSEDKVTKRAMKAAAAAQERSEAEACGPMCGCHSGIQKNRQQTKSPELLTASAESQRDKIQPIHRREVNLMSNKGKYVLAAVAGAAVGGSVVALSTRALPNLMPGMMAKCKAMIAGMGETDCGGSGMCKGMMTEKEQAPQQAACQSQEEDCHSEGGSCHGSH